MRDNLEGQALHAAQNIEELHALVDLARPYLEKVDGCPDLDELLMYPLVRAHSLRELCVNIKSVKAGLEPMSEFAAFYCFIADETLTREILLKIGFTVKDDYYTLSETDAGTLGFNGKTQTWYFTDFKGDTAWINKQITTVSQLWLLAECLGFNHNWKALES